MRWSVFLLKKRVVAVYERKSEGLQNAINKENINIGLKEWKTRKSRKCHLLYIALMFWQQHNVFQQHITLNGNIFSVITSLRMELSLNEFR